MSKSADVWRTRRRAYDHFITGYLPASAAALYLIDRLTTPGEPSGTIVDAGCGHGSDTIALLQAGFTVVSLDILERDVLRRVQDEVGTTDRWRFATADLVESIPLPSGSVHAVLDVAVLPRIVADGDAGEAGRYLREVHRVLATDGLYVLECRERLGSLCGTLFTPIEEREELTDLRSYLAEEHKHRIRNRVRTTVTVWGRLPAG